MCCKQNLWTDDLDFEYLCGECDLDNDILIKQAKPKQDVVPRAWSYIQTRNAVPTVFSWK